MSTSRGLAARIEVGSSLESPRKSLLAVTIGRFHTASTLLVQSGQMTERQVLAERRQSLADSLSNGCLQRGSVQNWPVRR